MSVFLQTDASINHQPVMNGGAAAASNKPPANRTLHKYTDTMGTVAQSKDIFNFLFLEYEGDNSTKK